MKKLFCHAILSPPLHFPLKAENPLTYCTQEAFLANQSGSDKKALYFKIHQSSALFMAE